MTLNEAAAVRWCKALRHVLDPEVDRCILCNRLGNYARIARNRGEPFCEEGHGLVQSNLAPDGSCVECARFAALVTAPGAPIRPAPSTWLDWGAVLQALDRRPLTRPLSTRELACMVSTLRAAHPEWSLRELVDWVNDSTYVTGLTVVYVQFVRDQWWRTRGLPDPRITLRQAVYAEADGDAWIAAARKGATRGQEVAAA